MKDGTAARRAIQPENPPKILTGQDLETLQSVIHQLISSRAYEIYETRGCEAGHDLEDWVQAEQELSQAESLEVIDTGQEIRILARVNSLSGQELAIGVSQQRVIILAENPRSGSAALTSAKPALLQVVDLVPKINPSEAFAQISNGILIVTLPETN
ncbi:MAG TPA: DUF2934 domain-containing protein [Terriglobia bacterium]|nr:DUF2934 domain-containing protein [Terriglobia bacterium]